MVELHHARFFRRLLAAAAAFAKSASAEGRSCSEKAKRQLRAGYGVARRVKGTVRIPLREPSRLRADQRQLRQCLAASPERSSGG